MAWPSPYRTVGNVEYRYCRKCAVWKLVECFAKASGTGARHRSHCKACYKEVRLRWEAKQRSVGECTEPKPRVPVMDLLTYLTTTMSKERESYAETRHV